MAHVNGRDISHYVVAVINNGDGCKTLGAHEEERIGKRSVGARGCQLNSFQNFMTWVCKWNGLLDSNDLLRPNLKITQQYCVKTIDQGEVDGLVPEELEQAQLA